MEIWKNAEVRSTVIIMVLLETAGSAVCFFLDWRAGAAASAVFLLLLILYLWDTRRRYRRMASLAADIDEILHGGENFNFSQYREGELSLLKNELTKLLIRLREQAALLEEEKGNLADSLADISHQLKTPLTSMNLIVAALEEGELQEQETREHLRELNRLLNRTQWLISALLKIARLEAGTIVLKQEKVSLEEMVKRALEPFDILMELKNQKLCMDMSGSFVGDLSWSSEAVGNLIKNCIEHMEEGTLWVSGEENAVYTQLKIRDTGDGIPEEDLPRLFERFYKGRNSGDQNVGIGLALARMIISRQNGTVKAQNHPEGGALFTVRFYKGVL